MKNPRSMSFEDFFVAISVKNYCCPVNISHADYAKFAKTMQRIYPLSINDFAETYIASLVCCPPDGNAQA